jgi:PAS domain S-box-containing protein
MISVLYVDDEPTLLELGRLFLEQSGDFRVTVMTSAQEALDSPALATFDAIVSDYQMPAMNGIEFLKKIRKPFGDIPFILFTGRGREEVVIEAINNGADFYLQKGGDPTAQFAELAHKIRQAVRRKQAERSLYESERRLADIIDFLPDAMVAVDMSGCVIAWNRANEDLTGVPASGVLGKGDYEYALSPYKKRRPFLFDMISEPDEKIQEYYTNIVHNGSAISAETSLASPKGRRIDVMVKAGPLYNQKGEVTGAIEVVRDITVLKKTGQDLRAAYEQVSMTEEELRSQFDELRVTNEQLTAAKDELHQQVDRLARNEETLRENEERLEMAQSIGRSGSWVYTIGTGTFWLSAEGSRILGYPAVTVEVPPEKIDACIPDPASVRRAMTGLIAEGKEYNIEYTIHPADGSGPKVIHSVARLEKDSSGRPVRVIGIARDITERRKADEEIAFKNTLLSTQQETSPDGILTVDENGKIISYNRKFTGIWNVPRELVERGLDEPVLRQISGQLVDPDAFLARVRYLYEHKDEKSFEELSLKDGRVMERFSSSVFGENQKYYGRIWYFRDITERLRAKEDLQKSEGRFVALFSNMLDGAALHELIFDARGEPEDYVILETNPAFGSLLGISRESVKGKTSREAYGVSEPPYLDIYARVARTGRPETFETYFEPMKKYFSISVYSPGKGRFATIFEDITERKEVEAELRESAEKYRALVETSPDMIWEIDCSGKFRYISPMVEVIMGYRPEELIKKPVTCLVAEQGRAQAQRELEKFFAANRSIAPFEVPARHSDGHDMVVEIRSFPITDSRGTVTGFRGVARDVTERKKAEETLRRANRQLTLLGSITRHDALNKITVILGYLKIASKKCKDPATDEIFQKIGSALAAMRSQIEFTRLYQNLGSRDPQWIALDMVLSGLPVPKRISLVTEICGVRLLADAMLEKVFTNLLDNSMRHGEHVSEIRVTSHTEGTALVVVFEDNGTGIAAAEKERIFERGYGKNTGLGLFLAREILALTGIAIRETGVPGTGVRFEIVVPEGVYRLDGTS